MTPEEIQALAAAIVAGVSAATPPPVPAPFEVAKEAVKTVPESDKHPLIRAFELIGGLLPSPDERATLTAILEELAL